MTRMCNEKCILCINFVALFIIMMWPFLHVTNLDSVTLVQILVSYAKILGLGLFTGLFAAVILFVFGFTVYRILFRSHE